MLSFNHVDGKSTLIASIKNKRKQNLIYLSEDYHYSLPAFLEDFDQDEELPKETPSDTFIRIENCRERIALVPRLPPEEDPEHPVTGMQSDRIYIAGLPGAGKSSIVAQYTKDFIKLFPDKRVILFSDVEEDPLLDEIEEIERIPLDEDFYENGVHPEELSNSLCIFDDIDSIQSKNIRLKAETLRDSLIQRGRHENICHVISTSHLACNSKQTKVPIQQASHIIVFPGRGAVNGIDYICSKYVGLNPKQSKKLDQLKSRWVCFRLEAPRTIITQHECFLMSTLDDYFDK
jgi:hypothetical protein